MFYCYILESLKDGSFYIGSTANIKRRILLHNQGRSKYARTKRPFKLIYFEEFKTLSGAYKREKQIKSWKKRSAIKNLIGKHAAFV